MKLRLWVLLLAGFTMAHPAWAAGDPPKSPETLPSRQANFAWDKTLLRASFSYRDVFTEELTAKFSSGLSQVLALRVYVFQEGSSDPIALSARTCRVAYDLWDEVYRIKITDPGKQRDTAAINFEGVLRNCGDARDLPVVDKKLLRPPKKYFLGVIVDVNPVSPELLAQMRRWLVRPQGSTGIGPGDALFGTFASLFVRQIGTSDKTMTFRTQAVAVVP